MSAPSDADAGVDPREELLLPPLEVPRPAAAALRGEHPEFLQPDIRRNEILRLLEAGLEDISVSRAGQSWGIPLPFAPDNVVYVWFDALINYAAAVGYGTDEARFAKWWPADLHVIGKDITRFHTVVWPAMLMSAGLALPAQVFGHGWVNFGGQRMSKSLGTSVDPSDVGAAVRPGSAAAVSGQGDRVRRRRRLHVGALRGALQRRPGQQPRQPGEPAVGDGREVPGVAPVAGGQRRPPCRRWPRRRWRATARRWTRFALHEGVAAAFQIVDAANEFIAETAPWALAKEPANAARLDAVLFDVAEAVRVAAVLLLPVMPASAAEILRRVGETTPAGRRCGSTATGAGAPKGSERSQRGPRCGRASMTTHVGRVPRSGPARRTSAVDEKPAGERRRRLPRQCLGRAAPTMTPHLDRRLHEGGAARGQGARGRGGAEVEEADQAEGGHRRPSSARSSPASPRRISPSSSSAGPSSSSPT